MQMSTDVLQVRCVCCVLRCFSRVWLCESWTVAHQAPLSNEYSRQNIGLPWALLQGSSWSGIEPALAGFLHGWVLYHSPPGKPIYLQTWGIFRKFLADFWSDLDLQFFPSVTRGGWFIRKQCFFLGRGMEIYFPLMCLQKGKRHTFIFLRQLVPYYPLLNVCGQGFRLAQ